MSIQPINLGAQANDGSGDGLRTGGEKINANFQELDTRVTTAQNKANEVDTLAGQVSTLNTTTGQLAGQVSTLQNTASSLDQRLDSAELELADHTVRIEALEATGPGGGSGSITPTFPEYRTNTLTKHYLGRQKTASIAAVTTTNVVVELESPFMAFRIGLPNLHTAAVTGVKVKVGLLNDRVPQAWLVDIVPDSEWVDVTWNGAATATLAQRVDVEIPSITFCDEIKFASYTRTDITAQRPLILIRIEYPAGSVATYPFLGISNWRQGTVRYMSASTQQTDGVTTPANFTQNLNTEQNVCIPTIQYYTEKTGKQILLCGDSTVEGVGGSPLGAGAVPIAAWRISTPDNPVEYANLSFHAQYPATYQKAISAFYDLIKPTHLVYSPYSVNEAAPTTGLTTDAANNLRLALAKTLEAARHARKPLKLILLEGLPVNASGKNLAAGDATRVAINTWLNTKLSGPVIATGYAAALSGVVNAQGQMEIAVGLTADNLHPNALGYETLADVIQPLIAAD